jgi:hypothetical protein
MIYNIFNYIFIIFFSYDIMSLYVFGTGFEHI